MSSIAVINSNSVDIEKKQERQDLPITLFFGLFFIDNHNSSLGSGLSGYYKAKSENENEKFYSIVVPHENVEGGLFKALDHIIYVLEGYSYSKGKLTIKFDIFGLQKGTICGIFFCHLFNPSSVIGISEFFIKLSSEIQMMKKEIKAYAKQIEIHSFTFISGEINNNEENIENSISGEFENTIDIEPNDKNILYGKVEENVYNGPNITNDRLGGDTAISRYKSSPLLDLYSWYVVTDTKMRDTVDSFVSKASNVALMMLFVPEPTALTKFAGIVLDIICIGGNIVCSITSLELALLRPCARDEELKKAGSYFFKAIPADKVLCKCFSAGFKFEIKRNNKLIEDIERQWKQVKKNLKNSKATNKQIKDEKKYYHHKKDQLKKRQVVAQDFIKNGELDSSLSRQIEMLTNLVYPAFVKSNNEK